MDTDGYVIARYVEDVYAVAVASIGSNIKAAREAAGIKTQTELAERLGVAQPQLSDWENDRYDARGPDLKNLMRIAAVIPCSMDALLVGLDREFDATRATAPAAPGRPMFLGATGAKLSELWPELKEPQRASVLAVARQIWMASKPDAASEHHDDRHAQPSVPPRRSARSARRG